MLSDVPLTVRHLMSVLPSPSKSPMVGLAAAGMVPVLTPAPVAMYQMPTTAGSAFFCRHRMSVMPSPSKSPSPAMSQPVRVVYLNDDGGGLVACPFHQYVSVVVPVK